MATNGDKKQKGITDNKTYKELSSTWILFIHIAWVSLSNMSFS